MDVQALEYLWQVVKSGLSRDKISIDGLADNFFSGDLDLPRPIDDMLTQYFAGGDDLATQRIAQWLVESFSLSGVNPERHLVLVAELLRRGVVAPIDAAKFVRMNESNFALLSEHGREVVRVAELLDEDGLLEAKSDVVTDLLKPYECLAEE